MASKFCVNCLMLNLCMFDVNTVSLPEKKSQCKRQCLADGLSCIYFHESQMLLKGRYGTKHRVNDAV